jgi:protein-S-isoprenylcysteine O-methyltransferase Ste14
MLASQLIYRFRGYLVTPPLIFAFFWHRWEVEVEYLIWPLGIGLVLFGIIIRIWAQQHLHYKLKVHKTLTATGPYSYSRNPMYTGNILICLGAIVLSELLWLLPIAYLYYVGLYSFVVRYEETHLLDKYGESYRRYRSEVPRWFPKISHSHPLRLINEYLYESMFIESASLLLILLFLLKEYIGK